VVRRYREVLLMIPRKNGKTPLAAGIAIYVFFCDREAGAQVFVAAAETEQAALLFRHARGMVEYEDSLNRRADIFRGTGHRSMVLKHDPGSFFKVVSADANTKHGGNTHLALIDELHAQKDRELVDVLETSMASATRAQPLMINITTADFERESICNEKHDYGRGVRDKKITDHRFLPVIFEALPRDNWRDPKVWAKANPNLGISVSLDYMQAKAKKAETSPAYANTFKRLHLNIRTAQAAMLIDIEHWDKCNGVAPTDEELADEECFGGLDLSQSSDLTAFALYFPRLKYFRVRFWLPGDDIGDRELRDQVPYSQWAEEGYIDLIPGNVIDYDYIIEEIVGAKEQFRGLKQVAYDPWNATQTALKLQDDHGFEMVAFRQGFITMNEPVKELLRMIKAAQINHGGNPIMRWMAINAAAKTDPADNIKICKKTSKKRVDGLVAGVMGLGLHIVAEKEEGDSYSGAGAEVLVLGDD
jgi:phage terminase large subunit-like protein